MAGPTVRVITLPLTTKPRICGTTYQAHHTPVILINMRREFCPSHSHTSQELNVRVTVIFYDHDFVLHPFQQYLSYIKRIEG